MRSGTVCCVLGCGLADPFEDNSMVIEGGIPATPYCEPVIDWKEEWAQIELDVLTVVNETRQRGGDCGSTGSFGPQKPLKLSAALRCAARVHARDMAERGFFDHENPDGDGPQQRIEAAGYVWTRIGENIAAGADGPQQAVKNLWMKSAPHCANILSPDFTEIGVGYSPSQDAYGSYWTQTFGQPR